MPFIADVTAASSEGFAHGLLCREMPCTRMLPSFQQSSFSANGSAAHRGLEPLRKLCLLAASARFPSTTLLLAGPLAFVCNPRWLHSAAKLVNRDF